MPGPSREPIGRTLADAAKEVSRAFDEALAQAGGSRPMWLILLALKGRQWETQAELARAVGVRGPTLTHHLDSLEDEGLVTRNRDPQNRRVQVVGLTSNGDAAFYRLREAAANFDEQLRAGLTEAEIDQMRAILERMRSNITAGDGG